MEKLIVIETNIDDSTGEELGHLLDLLFDAGARDAWYVPIYMKKNRPAVCLSVLLDEDLLESIANIIFDESSSIGLRYYEVNRMILDREFTSVDTKYGTVAGKRVFKPSYTVVYPEHDSVVKCAVEHGVSYAQVKEEFIKNR